ncbi:uncharacterized protein B0P05DRAFT_590277 [Gilbertella persicaria]|uniref:uncharacterized protein n=1 Tax=Gilbertella persicaria TaxID=101096 RepID=UPI00221FFAC7|nr:uncharacterized protein B0P05DRAFT_590277 [Gilbertella persicaria]KAI8063341.1 hypothetical protein B0P05DRAFT_590277 [Gilbertella persicaria]
MRGLTLIAIALYGIGFSSATVIPAMEKHSPDIGNVPVLQCAPGSRSDILETCTRPTGVFNKRYIGASVNVPCEDSLVYGSTHGFLM